MEDHSYPYAKEDGTGMSVDLVKAAYEAVGIEVECVVRPYKRLLMEIQKGKFLGGFNVVRESSTDTLFIWGDEMLYMAKVNYYVHKDFPLKVQSAEELTNDEVIGAMLGYEYGDHFFKNNTIKKELTASQVFNIKKLLDKRLDATLMAEKGANYWLSKMDLSGTIIPAFVCNHSEIYVAFSKVYPNAKFYANKLDEGLRLIKKNKSYAEIMNNY